jgi:lactate dehydrogenase-like 2-hydroxyacid dehydrogenase
MTCPTSLTGHLRDIKRFVKLKVVVRTGVGYDKPDRKALATRGIKACNGPECVPRYDAARY